MGEKSKVSVVTIPSEQAFKDSIVKPFEAACKQFWEYYRTIEPLPPDHKAYIYLGSLVSATEEIIYDPVNIRMVREEEVVPHLTRTIPIPTEEVEQITGFLNFISTDSNWD